MCGRYGLILKRDFSERFDVEEDEIEEKTVTATPGMIMPVIVGEPYSTNGNHHNEIMEMNPPSPKIWALARLRWGLVPFWAKDPKMGIKMFNARADDIENKPSFREPFKSRRCLVPVNYFYEWDEKKKPHIFKLKNEEYFALAGLWDTTNTYTVITTEPNEIVGKVHHRMPVILSRENEKEWIEKGGKEFLKPFDPGKMEERPV